MENQTVISHAQERVVDFTRQDARIDEHQILRQTLKAVDNEMRGDEPREYERFLNT